MIQTIELSALDTLFFRDGKPFSGGSENFAEGIFPPFPSTIYGALRTAYFSGDIDSLGDAETDEDPTRDLVITDIRYAVEGDTKDREICFVAPSDLVREKKEMNKEDGKFLVLTKEELPHNHSGPNAMLLRPKTDKKVEGAEHALMSYSNVEKYINGRTEELHFYPLNKFLFKESKIGIGIDKRRRSTREGMFYQVDFLRLDKLNIQITFKGFDLPENGVLRLGGEGKMVAYTTVQKVALNTAAIDPTSFKVVLQTPCVANDWAPSILKAYVEAAAVGRPKDVGGFNIKEKRPRPMRKAIPAGSVFYIKDDTGTLYEQLSKQVSLCKEEYYKKRGFGLFFLAKA